MSRFDFVQETVEKIKFSRIIYSGQIIIVHEESDKTSCTYFVINAQDDNPTILALEYLPIDILNLIGEDVEQICKNIYIITGYSIYAIISIFGENFDKERAVIAHIKCKNIEDSRIIAYLISELSEYAEIYYVFDQENICQKYIYEILEIMFEDSSANRPLYRACFIIVSSDELRSKCILDYFNNLLKISLTRFDTETKCDITCLTDFILLIIMNAQKPISRTRNFEEERGLISEIYDW